MAKRRPNIGNASDVAKLVVEERSEREKHLDDLAKILTMPEGVRVFAKYIEDGRIFSSSFTGNSHTFFNEGERNFALRMFSDICEAAPDVVQPIILKAKESKDV